MVHMQAGTVLLGALRRCLDDPTTRCDLIWDEYQPRNVVEAERRDIWTYLHSDCTITDGKVKLVAILMAVCAEKSTSSNNFSEILGQHHDRANAGLKYEDQIPYETMLYNSQNRAWAMTR